jgi:hypothetical protein
MTVAKYSASIWARISADCSREGYKKLSIRASADLHLIVI